MSVGRQFWVILHRWAGLTLALFLAVSGVTGTVLAFYDELDAMFASRLHRTAPPQAGAAMLDPLALREAVLAAHPGGVVNYVPFHVEPGRSLLFNVERADPETGELRPWSGDWDELYLDPYTGETLGHRQWGNIGQGLVNIMPFLYRLHYTLALGDIGELAFGMAALVWTLDCFVGLYLTFPLRSKTRKSPAKPQRRNWAAGWKPSWQVRWGAGRHKLTFDLHRAGGLWVWPLLLVFAWSGVSFSLTEVHDPVMRVFGYERIAEGIALPERPAGAPVLDFPEARQTGETLVRQEMERLGLAIDPDPARESGLYFLPGPGIYSYIFTSTADFRRQGGRSLLLFDGTTGQKLKLVLPQGQNAANTFTEWLGGLHMAAVWGLPWRIAVSLLGLIVTALSVTGVLIWMRKRSARLARKRPVIAR